MTKGNRLTINWHAIVITLVIALGLAVAYSVWLYASIMNINYEIDQLNRSHNSMVVSPEAPADRPGYIGISPETVVDAEPAPYIAPVEVDPQAIPAAEPESAPTNKWSAVMLRAGIAEEDHAIVDQLVFTGHDWNLESCACANMIRYGNSPIARLQVLHRYVTHTHGSWAAAQVQAAQGSW